MEKAMAVILILVSFSSGCATIIHGGSTQDVGFSSTPAGATVKIDGQQLTTPGTFSLKRSKDYNITFEKDGYEPASATIVNKVSGWIAGNILFGGLIGLIVDFASGGAYNLDPNNVQVTLQKKPDIKPQMTP